MKTTFDLPDALVTRVKLRALRDGVKLKVAVADLLRKGLKMAAQSKPEAPAPITRDKKTGLPVIECLQAGPDLEMTPERVADILLAQEVEWSLVAQGHHMQFSASATEPNAIEL